MRSKKVVKVARKNKINAELSGGPAQPGDLSATLGEPHPPPSPVRYSLVLYMMNAAFHFHKFILSPARSLPEGDPGSEGTSGSENLTMLDRSVFLSLM